MFPLFSLWILYLVFALIFPDRLIYIAGLVLATVLWLSSRFIGQMLLRYLRRGRDLIYQFPLGLGALLIVLYAMFSVSTNVVLFYCIWGVLCLLSLTQLRILNTRLPVWLLWSMPFVVLGIWSTFTPTVFFDALVYHLGLPYQYMSAGRMSVIHHNLYSSFPPLDQTLNLLFIGIRNVAGIKIFSMIILFELAALLSTSFRSPRVESELAVLPLLLMPSAWILVHVVTADLLVALFFCSGVVLLCSEAVPPGRLFVIALLFTFACWTKSNVWLYVALIGLLWIAVYGTVRWKRLAVLYGLIFIFLLPLLLRNFFVLGDPVYPAFANVFHAPDWSPAQEKALHMDSFQPKVANVKSFLLAPLDLTFHPGKFGSAAEIGILPLIGIFVFLFAQKTRVSIRIFLYCLICMIFWIFVFPNFRQGFPVFILLYRPIADGLHALKSKMYTLVPLIWIAASIVNLYLLAPLYRFYFPLIRTDQTSDIYLQTMLDYYPATKFLQDASGKIMLVGETRSAYFRTPVTACTAYDQHPLILWLVQSKNADDLLQKFKEEDVQYILYNRREMNRLVEKYQLWKPAPDQQKLLQIFLKEHGLPKGRTGSVYVFGIK